MSEFLPTGEERRRLPRGAAADFSFNKFNGAIALRTSTPLVGVSPDVIVPNNPDRISYLVHNNSASEIFIGWNQQITTSLGILLPPNGGFFQAEVDIDGDIIGWGLFGVTSVAAQQLFVIESIRYLVRKK